MRKRRLVAAGIGVALVAAAARGLLRRFAIVEPSMRPSLLPGDWVIAQRLRGMPQRGEVVVFPHPAVPEMNIVKRVIALPGERVEIANGQVHIDGMVLAELWADGPTLPDGAWEVSNRQIWVLGDHRALSTGDSRSLGSIPLELVDWKVVARYWPAARAGRL